MACMKFYLITIVVIIFFSLKNTSKIWIDTVITGCKKYICVLTLMDTSSNDISRYNNLSSHTFFLQGKICRQHPISKILGEVSWQDSRPRQEGAAAWHSRRLHPKQQLVKEVLEHIY